MSFFNPFRRKGEKPADDRPPKEYFAEIYRNHLWAGRCSKSGPGSEGRFAEQKISVIEDIINEFGVASILDIGCGDMHWMKELIPKLARYHGVDAAENVIRINRQRFTNDRVSFQWLDLSVPSDQERLLLRNPDLILCIDVFGHLLTPEIDSLLNFLLGGLEAAFLLVTNRRDADSSAYLTRGKTRHQGIDIECHPAFIRRSPKRLRQFAALYPDDYFDLYDLK